MINKIKQYKNLILLAVAVILFLCLIALDPLGFCAQRSHERAAIQNQMAIERAEAEQQIAIIRAQTEAELAKIKNGKSLDGTTGVLTDANKYKGE